MARRKKVEEEPLPKLQFQLPVPNKQAQVEIRARPPRTHKEGKPVRGVRGPGVRGPGKTQAEINAEKGMKIVVVPKLPPPPVIHDQPTMLDKRQHYTRNQKLNRQLQDMIRIIGNEEIDHERGWTRIIMVIRRLYADAAMGKTPAANLLFERGWGKVPTPVQMDFRSELLTIIEDTGLTRAEIDQDPVLRMIMTDAVEAEYKELPNDQGSEPGPVAGELESPSES